VGKDLEALRRDDPEQARDRRRDDERDPRVEAEEEAVEALSKPSSSDRNAPAVSNIERVSLTATDDMKYPC
jgi:hypothetical protein